MNMTYKERVPFDTITSKILTLHKRNRRKDIVQYLENQNINYRTGKSVEDVLDLLKRTKSFTPRYRINVVRYNFRAFIAKSFKGDDN